MSSVIQILHRWKEKKLLVDKSLVCCANAINVYVIDLYVKIY